jgi:hypothetical protein
MPVPYCGPQVGNLRKLKWEVMEHPAHNPDLATSDFHLSGPLKEALAGDDSM